MRLILFLIVFLLTLKFACPTTDISRDMPTIAYLGEIFNETITISTSEPVNFFLAERVPEQMDVVSPMEYISIDNFAEVRVMYIKQLINLNQVTRIVHRFRPSSLGRVHFQPITLKGVDKTEYSLGTDIIVACRRNGECNPGENYQLCPEDCPSGSSDGICDGKKDGVCDTDCISGDPDCNAFCGDKRCDESVENNYNCPQDCGGFTGDYTNTKVYFITVSFEKSSAEVSFIELKDEQYYEQAIPSTPLTFILLDKNGGVISSHKKANSNESGSAVFKIPFSPDAAKLNIYRDDKLITSAPLTQFSVSCPSCSDARQICSNCRPFVWLILAAVATALLTLGVWLRFRKN